MTHRYEKRTDYLSKPLAQSYELRGVAQLSSLSDQFNFLKGWSGIEHFCKEFSVSIFSQAFQINSILSKIGLKLNIFARSSASAYFPIRPQSDIVNFVN